MALLTVATCACAVAVANGQVSVPGVRTPPVNTPPLQNLPKVPSAPQVQVPSLPKSPSVNVPTTPSLPNTPSVRVPGVGGAPSAPSVRLPSAGATGGGGGASGRGTGPGAGTAAGGSGSSAAAGPGASAASGRAARRRPLTPRERSARHERRLREAARELEGCLPALPSFERDVIVFRGGLHGRRPLSVSQTAARLHVGAGRVRSAERSGLAGLRRADATQGCGLQTGAGRNAAARRLATGSVPSLSPLAVAGHSPALVSTDKLGHGRGSGKVLASSASGHGAKQEPRRAGVLPTSGGDNSALYPGLWAALLAALMIAAGCVLLLWRRRVAEPYGYTQSPSVYPYGWSSTSEPEAPPAPSHAPEQAAAPEAAVAPTPATPRRRDRAMQGFAGLVASGAALSLLLGRLAGRRRRRH